MEMKDFNKEFVERTREMVEQLSSGKCKYEMTLLINCMLALVSLPTEETGNTGDDETFKREIIAELNRLGVVEKYTNDDKLFRTVKNALSHMYIEVENKNGEINEIFFCDKKDRDAHHYHTKLKFNTQQLKEFALFVAEKHLERLSTNREFR